MCGTKKTEGKKYQSNVLFVFSRWSPFFYCARAYLQVLSSRRNASAVGTGYSIREGSPCCVETNIRRTSG